MELKKGSKLFIDTALFEHNACDYFVTNDKKLKSYDKNRIHILGEIS